MSVMVPKFRILIRKIEEDHANGGAERLKKEKVSTQRVDITPLLSRGQRILSENEWFLRIYIALTKIRSNRPENNYERFSR